MTVTIPINLQTLRNDLPRVRSEISSLNAEEKKAIREHLGQLSLQRRLENEINREVKEQIAQRRRLVDLTNKLNASSGPAAGGMGLGGALGALGIGFSIQQAVEFGKEAEKMGRELEGVQTRLRNTLGGAEEYAKAIALAREETKGMTSETELASGMFTFLNARLAENVEEAANLSRAQGILVSTFGNLGANEEKFVRLLSGGNQALFDNFNLTLQQVNARKAQIEATQGLSEAEAKQAAIKELVIEKADELEGSLTDGEIAARQYQAAADDLTASIGQALAPAFASARDGAAAFFNELSGGIQGFTFAAKQISVMEEAQKRLTKETGEAQGGFRDFLDVLSTSPAGGMVGPAAAQLKDLLETTDALSDHGDEQERFAEIYQEVLGEREKEAPIIQANTEAIEENTEALDKEAKRLEKVAELRERSVRKALEIEENFQEDSQETWDDWREDQESLFQDYGEKRADILEKSAKDAAKIERDLAKDLNKLAKDLGKDLAKITQDENKKVNQLKKDAAKEQKQESRKRSIDTLADERLFQFELRAMAAEGDAAGIQQALERRAIEEQIAKEKAQVQKDIDKENLQEEIQQVRQAAQERRHEREQEAEERRQELMAEAEEARILQQEELAQALEDEKQNFLERSEELAKHRRDKLDQLEKSRREAIAKIGQELTEIKDITQEEIKDLVPAFNKLGEDVGESFTDGFNKGFDVNKQISGLLGQSVGSQSTPTSFSGGVPNRLGMNFQHGGSFIVGGSGGPDSQRVSFNASPGERVTITPPGQGGITINANGPGVNQLVSILQRKVDEAMQEYTDTVLAPALS